MKSFIISSVILASSINLSLSQHSAILEKYLVLAMEHNITLKQEQLNVQQSLAALNQAKGMFLPEVSLNASYMRSSGGRTINIPVGDLVNPIYENLNALSDQNRFPTNLGNEEIQLLPNNFHDTRIELRQPIFNSEIYHNHRAKRSLVSMNESKLNTYENELMKEVKVSYFQYLQTNSVVNVYQNTKELLEELLRVNKSLVKNDKATIDIVYRAEFEISDINSKITEAVKNVILAKSYFNFLLNRELDEVIEVDESLAIGTNIEKSVLNYQQHAISGRQELAQLTYAVETQNHLLNLQKGRKLPSISLGAQAGYQGFGYEFNNNQDYALLSVNLEFPLFTGFQNNSRIQQSKIELHRLELEHEKLENRIKLEVIEAYRNLQAAEAEYHAKTAAAKSAEKNFKIITRKYQENLVLLVEFLDARTKYTNSQTSLAIAKYLVMIRGAELERTATL